MADRLELIDDLKRAIDANQAVLSVNPTDHHAATVIADCQRRLAEIETRSAAPTTVPATR
jgi:hypothetical protein